MICCLCFTVYFVKQKRAQTVNVLAAPAAMTSGSVEVTLLVQLTPIEVQRGVAATMRRDGGHVYHFTPAGGKYHVDGCFITDRSARSFGLTPCPRCAVGKFFQIFEGADRQVFFADTKTVKPWSLAAHYHVDRTCGRTYEMSTKEMCLHCVDTRRMQMQIARLTLQQPFCDQEFRAGRIPPREDTLSASETVVLMGQLWG
jgi:hypothetical protein